MELGALARRQGGVFTRRQARECGITSHAIDAALQSGRWCSVYADHRGVLADSTLPLTNESRLWAAVLVVGNPCGIAIASAAACWGWSRVPEDVTVVVSRARRPRPPSGVNVKRLPLDTRDLTTRGWLPITTQIRTLVDCLRFLPLDRASDILDRCQQVHHLPLARVASQIPQLGRGTAQARQLLRAADGSLFAAEKLAIRLVRAAGITGWVANDHIELHGVQLILDLAFPELKLAIEIDGFAFHSTPDRFQRDRRRQNLLIGAGWMVLRFTWADLTDRPDYVIDQIQRAVSARLGTVSTA